MKIGRVDGDKLDEFERLGLKYASLQLEIAAILMNCEAELSVYDETKLYEITMAQDELHKRRMELIRYQTN